MYTQDMPPSSAAAYLLLLEPRKDLSDLIQCEKHLFAEKYKADAAGKGKPHITLVSFSQYTTVEDRIRHRLRNKTLSVKPFAIELMDYGSFPSHTIYINVISRLSVQNLVKDIRADMQAIMKMDNDNKPHFIMEPHITIARKLKPWQYEAGWLEYSHKKFRAKFIAGSMILLRKSPSDAAYKLAERFEFMDMPKMAQQGMVF